MDDNVSIIEVTKISGSFGGPVSAMMMHQQELQPVETRPVVVTSCSATDPATCVIPKMTKLKELPLVMTTVNRTGIFNHYTIIHQY